MSCISSVINQKGGTGKTTTAQALGAGLTGEGYKVLFIDLDAQGNLTRATGATAEGYTILEVLQGKARAIDAIQDAPGGHIIAAGPGLGAEGILTRTGKEYRLAEALEPVKKKFDYIIVDCPPSLGVLSVNALTTSDYGIIPAGADAFSLQALEQIHDTAQAVQKYTNKGLQIMGVLICRYSGRSILSRELAEMIGDKAQEMGTRLFNTRIRENISIKEAQQMQQDIFTYAPRSNGAVDYRNFVQEVLSYGNKENI